MGNPSHLIYPIYKGVVARWMAVTLTGAVPQQVPSYECQVLIESRRVFPLAQDSWYISVRLSRLLLDFPLVRL